MIIGDTVYFFYTDSGLGVLGDYCTIVYPKHLQLLEGKIIDMNVENDYVHVYVKGTTNLLKFRWCYHEDYFFESFEKAIAEMTEQLNESIGANHEC